MVDALLWRLQLLAHGEVDRLQIGLQQPRVRAR
jgi:hypothetical protein